MTFSSLVYSLAFLKHITMGNYVIKQLRAWYLLLQSGLAVLCGLPPSLSSRKFFWLSVGSPVFCVPLSFSSEQLLLAPWEKVWSGDFWRLHGWKTPYSHLLKNLSGYRILGWKSCSFGMLKDLLDCLLCRGSLQTLRGSNPVRSLPHIYVQCFSSWKFAALFPYPQGLENSYCHALEWDFFFFSYYAGSSVGYSVSWCRII